MIAGIVNALLGQIVNTIRTEIDAAVAEIQGKLKQLATGSGLVVFAAGFLFVALVFFILAGAAALSLIWPLWQVGLVVGGFVLLIAIILAAVGLSKIKKNKNLKPERATESIERITKLFNN